MNKDFNISYILFLIVCTAFSQQANKKNTILLKSTITTVSSSTVLLSNKKNTILQSIGQSGIIGKIESNSTIVQQGFLNGARFFTINNFNTINFQETLNVVISPNPFISYIKINFSSKTHHSILLRIYDVNGKVLTNNEYEATESIIVPMEKFIIGNYIVHIISGENKFVKKILKVE